MNHYMISINTESNVNNSLIDKTKGNGDCHSYGLVNYNTTLTCNRNNVVPLYVQDICKIKANGCPLSFSNCVKKLTYNSNCNQC